MTTKTFKHIIGVLLIMAFPYVLVSVVAGTLNIINWDLRLIIWWLILNTACAVLAVMYASYIDMEETINQFQNNSKNYLDHYHDGK